VGFLPGVGQCHDAQPIRLTREAFALRDCAQTHAYQVVFVGEVTGRPARLPAPPEVGSDHQRDLWARCDEGFTDFFGGDWKQWRLKLKISFPSVIAWDTGQRWFACHAAAIDDFRWYNVATTGSFENGASSRSDLKLGCLQWVQGPTVYKACHEPHNAEFVTVFKAITKVKDPEFEQLTEEHTVCKEHAQLLAGTSVSLVSLVWVPRETDWQMGDNHVRCFLMVQGKPVTKSFRK
jgi:hypothetical protein